MKKVISFDPGLTNFAVWLGSVTTDAEGRIVPTTYRIEKIDLKASKKAMYEAVADTIMSSPWMTEPGIEAVVETQAMCNIPARIVGTTIYGVLRGLSIPVCFSGAKLKNDAMALISEQYGIALEPKPTKESVPDSKKRNQQMHAVNKRNSKAIVSRVLGDIKDTETGDKIANARDVRGKLKADDLTDAVLLGIGLLVRDKLLCPKAKKRGRVANTITKTLK